MFSATERLHWLPGEHFQLRLQPLPRSPQSSLLLPPRKVIRHVWHEGCSRLVSRYSRLHPCLSPSPRSSLSTHQSPVGPHPPWPCRRLLSVPGCTPPPCLGRPWGDLRRLDSHYTMSLWSSFLHRCSQKILDETETSPIWYEATSRTPKWPAKNLAMHGAIRAISDRCGVGTEWGLALGPPVLRPVTPSSTRVGVGS